MLRRIISGGQTGVDRGALDAALEVGLACGGWCPKGRRAQDGPIPLRYPVRETPAPLYAQRTDWNVRDSDGTLILVAGPMGRGTALTKRLALLRGKPLLTLDLRLEPKPEIVCEWVRKKAVSTLNVAGPREHQSPGIQGRAMKFVREVLKALIKANPPG